MNIVEPINYREAFGKYNSKKILQEQKPVCENDGCDRRIQWSPNGYIIPCKCEIDSIKTRIKSEIDFKGVFFGTKPYFEGYVMGIVREKLGKYNRTQQNKLINDLIKYFENDTKFEEY